jgi:1-hydroxycarotenoid 3,4-desaturase
MDIFPRERQAVRARQIVIIGAGMGGLAAALRLAAHGFCVTVLEKAARPGGKLREVQAGGRSIDAGPTVFTMKWVFEELMAEAGLSLDDALTTRPVDCLARHAWGDGARLDLFADLARSADAIGTFAGKAEADAYLDFCARSRHIYSTLLEPFMRSSRPSPAGLMNRVGIRGLGDLLRISPFTTFARALEDHFRDPRLRQLFGRYATYCGSSPFNAPATLMLVAHVEQEGVWLIEGGMHRLAASIENAAKSKGARFVYGKDAARILVSNGRTSGVETVDGERFPADAIIMNGDVAALAAGLLGSDVSNAAQPVTRAARSLSAVTWAMTARTSGFPLTRHNVFFSANYRDEFNDIFRHARLPRAPTVYVCAQDRDDSGALLTNETEQQDERLLCLVNAPANGDHAPVGEMELQQCEQAAFKLLRQCGLTVSCKPEASIRTSPADFNTLFPATGGALYGRASHGWMASFQRPGARTKLPGLYAAGGSVHPGPGLPMAALSGRQAAASVMEDLASMSALHRVATIGGTSTP